MLNDPYPQPQVRVIKHASFGQTGSNTDSFCQVICYGFGSDYYGAKAKFSVHALPDVMTGQISSSSIQLIYWNHDDKGEQLMQIQAGWIVHPDLYGDTQTHLYTFWTADDALSTGCYNTLCCGFVVQSGSPIVPGSVLSPVSTYGGQQIYITLSIYRDSATGNWLLTYEDDTQTAQVGYWPSSLFPDGLAQKANQVNFGGYAGYSLSSVGPPMGSGHLPSVGEYKAASFKNIQFFDQFQNPYELGHSINLHSDISECYDVNAYYDLGDGDGQHFYYGGPKGCKSHNQW